MGIVLKFRHAAPSRTQYPFLGDLQPKNMCETNYRDFGSFVNMKRAVDSVAFGRRIAERRADLGLSQPQLGLLAGYSQQNIGWFEKGGARRPERAASALADALQTTREWLLWKEGPKHVGPRFLPPPKMLEKYSALTPEQKSVVSQAIENVDRPPKKKKRAS